MKIAPCKIPSKMTNLPATREYLNLYGHSFLMLIIERLYQMDGSPSNSTASYKQIANELYKFVGQEIKFKFYCSKNIFIGHKVISHANNKNTINYNTRFHSVKSFTVKQWVMNFFHELTHLADQISVYSFDHDGQNDYNAAPMVVGRIAGEIFDQQGNEWKLPAEKTV